MINGTKNQIAQNMKLYISVLIATVTNIIAGIRNITPIFIIPNIRNEKNTPKPDKNNTI
jgi:hypothetical protein